MKMKKTVLMAALAALSSAMKTKHNTGGSIMNTTAIKTVGISLLFAAGFTLQAQASVITHTDTFRVVDTDNNGTGDVVQDSFLNAGNNTFDMAVVSSFEMTGFSSGAEIGNVDFSITRQNGGGGIRIFHWMCCVPQALQPSISVTMNS